MDMTYNRVICCSKKEGVGGPNGQKGGQEDMTTRMLGTIQIGIRVEVEKRE